MPNGEENQKAWQEIAAEVIAERDPQRLAELIADLDRALAEPSEPVSSGVPVGEPPASNSAA
jgi:hypothetical protein